MNVNTVKRMKGLTGGDLLLIFVAGVIGEIVLEFIAWVVFPNVVPMSPQIMRASFHGQQIPQWVADLGPHVVGMPMRPHLLVIQTGQALMGGATMPIQLAIAIHLALGSIIFPLTYVYVKALLGIRSWLVAGLLWGTLLWLIAQLALAPIAGRPIFLGFIPYTWGSLVAHNVYAVTVAYVLERLRHRFPELHRTAV